MTGAAARHPVLANDIARSWICLGAAIALVTGVTLAAVFVAPVLFVDMGQDRLARLSYYAMWSVFCTMYTVLSLVAFLRLDHDRLRALTAETDPGSSRWRRFWWAFNGGGAIWWALFGAGLTLVTLVELIATAREPLTPLVTGASVTVVVATAALFIVAFAVNYAREDAVRGGLEFPGDEGPRFGDYLYFSVQLTTTFGGSDVQITTRPMRRIVSMHSIIAFTFNTVIVALLVSVLVGRLA